MRYISAAFGLLATCCYSVAACADFQTEIGFGYTQIKTRAHPRSADDWLNYNHSGQQIYLDLHFNPVTTEAVPLSDAAFLGRSSHLRLSQNKLDFEAGVHGNGQGFPTMDSIGSDEEARARTREVQGFWADSESDFALRLGYARYEDSFISESKFKAYIFGLGYYLSDSSYVELQYLKYRFSNEPITSPPRSNNPETYQLAYKNVVFSGSRAVTDIEFQVTKTPFSEQLGTSLAWYTGATGKIGLRVAMNNRDRIGLPSYQYGAFYEVFFDQQWLLRFTYDTGRHGVTTDAVRVTEQSVGVTAAVRF